MEIQDEYLRILWKCFWQLWDC